MVKPNFSNEKGEKQSLLGSGEDSKTKYSGNDKVDGKKTKKKDVKKKVSLGTLFRYATAFDVFLMVSGTIFSIIHGAGFPLLSIVFGDMSNLLLGDSVAAFGQNVTTYNNNSYNQNYTVGRHLMQVLNDVEPLNGNITGIENSLTSLLYSSTADIFGLGSTAPSPSKLVANNQQTTGNIIHSSARIEMSTRKPNDLTMDIISGATNAKIATSTSKDNGMVTPDGHVSISAAEALKTTISSIPVATVPGIPAVLTVELFNSIMTKYSLYYVGIGVIVFFATFLQTTFWQLSCERQIFRIRQEFFYMALRQEIGWFDTHQSGELTSRLSDDLERIREGMGEKFSAIIQHLASFLTGFVVGFIKGWQLTLVVMSLTPLLALSSAYIGRLISTSTAREQQKYAEAGAVASEIISAIRTVTAFNGQEREISRYEKSLHAGYLLAVRKYTFMSIGIGFTFLVLYGAYALAFWYGAQLIMDGVMTPGSVYTVFFAVLIGSNALGQASPPLNSISIARGTANFVFSIIDQVPKIDPYSIGGKILDSVEGHIEFRGVKFNYPTRPNTKVLKKFNLNVKPGQTIALCGSSGSGKSTVVNLLLRFYDVLDGQVTIDGHDIRNINLAWLRHIIGVVSQEPVLFDRTICENIRYGRDDVTYDEIVKAAKMANAHDFICSLPQAYSTMVGESGAQLSGGQKQRIAIARALVRDPKILLLDEATSALDSESESIVQEALDKARKGRTTIIIAHRLSTIKNADVIHTMELGEIKESGSHRELMDQEGLYYSLVMKQTFEGENGYTTTDTETVHQASGSHLRSRKMTRLSSIASSVGRDKDENRLLSDAIEEDVQMATFTDIMRQIKPEWLFNTLGCLGCILTGASMPIFALFFAQMFEVFSLPYEEMNRAAFFWAMMYLVLAVVQFVGYIVRIKFLTSAAETLTKRLRYLSFKNVLRQEIAWFDDEKHSTGKIATRLATDAPMVKSAGGIRIGSVLSAIVSMGAGFAIAYIFGWKLALAITVAVPLLIFSGAIQMRIAKGNQKRDAELMADAGKIAAEALENIRTVHSLTKEELFFNKYVESLLEPFVENKKQALIYGLACGFAQSLTFFMYAGAFRLGAYFITTGELEVTNMYRVFFALSFTAVSVGEWMSYLPDYTKGKLSAGLIFNLMSIEPVIDSYSQGGIKPDIIGDVQLNNVHFRYPARPDVTILRGIDLYIKNGHSLALVGPSGCGKSTIVSLIERFYDPTQGQILIDGHNLRTMNLKYVRENIAIVSQEPTLFNCSIRDNITYGMTNKVYEDDVINACKAANIHDFVNSLPEGYDTLAGEKGTQLSGGQKQRIAIARAIIRNPRILLLDEATSALDTESEKLVQEALDKAREGRTCIIIAHRLSTIQNADVIAVVDKGRVAEYGSHNDLLSKKGKYYSLIKKQRISH